MGAKRENVRYEAVAGKPGRLLIVRLRSGSDLINGILKKTVQVVRKLGCTFRRSDYEYAWEK